MRFQMKVCARATAVGGGGGDESNGARSSADGAWSGPGSVVGDRFVPPLLVVQWWLGWEWGWIVVVIAFVCAVLVVVFVILVRCCRRPGCLLKCSVSLAIMLFVIGRAARAVMLLGEVRL